MTRDDELVADLMIAWLNLQKDLEERFDYTLSESDEMAKMEAAVEAIKKSWGGK